MRTQTIPWLMLISRSILFVIAQTLIALFLVLTGAKLAWTEAARWWIFLPIFANAASILLLIRLFRAEGQNYFEILRFSRKTMKNDLIWFFASSLIGLPIASAPMNILGSAIFGDSMIPVNMLFRSIPDWALVVGLLFPLTIGFAELPTYFVYSMPRLFANQKSQPALDWAAWLFAVFFLSIQHCFLPFIADWGFILWRGLMYLPFAMYAGMMIKLRPSLMPYFALTHALMDMSVLSVYKML